MPTEMELTLEQTQQGASYEVSTEILLEPTSNKLMVDLMKTSEFDESNTYVLERFDTSAGNPIKEILLKLSLPNHRIFKDGGEGTSLQEKVIDLEKAKTAQAKEITSLKKRIKLVESSNDASLGAREDASKQGRKMKDLHADAEVTFGDKTS
ncbi:hypothetical protein Tco_0323868 [Tanacetum coccineum]